MAFLFGVHLDLYSIKPIGILARLKCSMNKYWGSGHPNTNSQLLKKLFWIRDQAFKAGNVNKKQ